MTTGEIIIGLIIPGVGAVVWFFIVRLIGQRDESAKERHEQTVKDVAGIGARATKMEESVHALQIELERRVTYDKWDQELKDMRAEFKEELNAVAERLEKSFTAAVSNLRSN